MPGQREMNKLSRKLDKVVHRDEMESHLDSAFDVTKAKRYVALRDEQQRSEKKAWEAIKGNGTRIMCTWGEFVILQEELNDAEKMRNVAQLIVDREATVEDEHPHITAKDGYDHYYKITCGQHELWMGRSSLMGDMRGGVLDKNGETNSQFPIHRIVCQRHMCQLCPKEKILKDEEDKTKTATTKKNKKKKNSKKNKSNGMLASFMAPKDMDQIRKKEIQQEGEILTMEDVEKGMLLTRIHDKWDIQPNAMVVSSNGSKKKGSKKKKKMSHNEYIESTKMNKNQNKKKVRGGGKYFKRRSEHREYITVVIVIVILY